MAEITFEPPTPGPWGLDLTHWPRPVPRLYAALYPVGADAGMRESHRAAGSPQDGVAFAFIHGWCYGSSRFVTDEDELARRVARSIAVWEERPWRDALARWDAQVKPATRQRHLELLRVDLDALDDRALADHLAACCEHFVAMARQHHRFNGTWMLPVHDYAATVAGWTGKDMATVLRPLEGHSAVSRASDDMCAAAAAAVRASPDLQRLVDGDGEPAATVASLRDAAADAPGLLDWLDLHGARHVSGFDFACPTASEMPALLLAQLRRTLYPPDPGPAEARRAEVVALLRDAVPAAERERFDDLLAEACRQHRIRDERGIESDVTAGGIVRHAVLHAGARLAAAGRLDDAADLLEAEPEELVALVAGTGGPSRAELAARREHRKAAATVVPPEVLGDGPPVVPPFAPEQARLARALAAMREASFGDRQGERDDARVLGLGAYPGSYEGVARVVAEPADLLALEPGEVLVMVSATEAVNVVLPLVGAIVTDRGGVASHAAIVARECGLPAVVGCLDATARLTTGTRVRVDGSRGEVTVVE